MRIYDLPSEKGRSGAAAVDSCTKFLNRMFRSPRVKASSSMSIMSKQLRRNECDWYSVITILIAMVGQAVNVRLLVEDGDRNLHFKKADLFQRKTQLCRLIAIDDIHWFIIKNKHIYVVRAKDKNFFEETSTYPKLDRGIKYGRMICLLLYMICLLLFMILSHRIFLAIMCDNHAMKKVLINLLFLRMNILLMIISLLLMRVSILLLIISLETLKYICL